MAGIFSLMKISFKITKINKKEIINLIISESSKKLEDCSNPMKLLKRLSFNNAS